MADENIRRMCFSSGGLLFSEFAQLLSGLFQRKNKSYRRIVEALADRPLTLSKLCSRLRMSKSGVTSARVQELEKTGFVTCFHTWDIRSGETAGQFKIRLSDNYLRFYLKAILPHVKEIGEDRAFLPSNLESLLGLQFENLVINNRRPAGAGAAHRPG